MESFLTRPLGRIPFAIVGCTLMVLKYGVEATIISFHGGGFYSPLAFLLPLISLKSEALQSTPSYVAAFIGLWSLPFVFLALVFSIRRCIDAAINPWCGFWVLCPIVNLPFMVAMCGYPTRPPVVIQEPEARAETQRTWAWISSTLTALVLGAVMLAVGVYWLRDYSAALFFVTPVMMGAVSSYRLQAATPISFGSALGIALLSVSLALVVMLLFALEGVVCIMMAAPIVYAAGGIGGVLGYAIALSSSVHKQNWGAAVLVLPAVTFMEARFSEPQIREVVSVVEIDAPRDKVWNEVIAFSPITEPPTGWLYWGIAYPVKARIEGRGAGAIRYCEFSTGAFVEPITVWDEPQRLAFEVTSQPSPLTELSPYRLVHAPHLDGFLASRRGEFRLIELPSGRTRLEGHTWYDVDMYPQSYWHMWSDSIIHAIHLRVLEHIQEQVTQPARVAQSSL